MKVRDKVIVVTGAGGGIGRELVFNLLYKGAKVAAIDINSDALEETLKQAGGDGDKVSTHIVNLTDREAVEKLPEQVISCHGTVDGIVNNAGIIHSFVNINDLDYDKIKLVMDINFYGTLYMVKSFIPYLLDRPVGHVTNVSSMGGFLPVPGQSIYGASKAAVKLMTEGLYAELKDTSVNVTVVFPGGVRTDIMKNSKVEGVPSTNDTDKAHDHLLTPKEAAEIIINGMEKDQYRVLAGKDAKMMDKLYRLSPQRAVSIITKQMKKIINK
ncbi:SDR family NAD(P)-dependent oxidoreductase [Halalkalibacter hemicellulosilyticus]|uniref:Short-chain dehydrogenase/reductase SDR n=1 Tax=Halalkalibacter hemicellulosilyticusJCM 9152 TaxID=1236971 RepID=W4QIS9_9BACI|nr:SDR family oxidoreductase [Halalkalibacter hemicellulosilyticus]GAE31543.1 short-chain dehydrogenase/reductase SDR [Halalkalibacter hemicellulosilyticusJCM 9152]